MTGRGASIDDEQDDHGRGSGRLLLVAALALALVAAAVLVLSDSARMLRLAVVAALWAALVGAFLAAKYRKQVGERDDEVADLQSVYELELEREVAARREYELEIESETRKRIEEESRADIESLRADLRSLRDNLQALLGGGDVLVERVALRAESTRLRSLASSDQARLTAAPENRVINAKPAITSSAEKPSERTELIERVAQEAKLQPPRREPLRPEPTRPEPARSSPSPRPQPAVVRREPVKAVKQEPARPQPRPAAGPVAARLGCRCAPGAGTVVVPRCPPPHREGPARAGAGPAHRTGAAPPATGPAAAAVPHGGAGTAGATQGARCRRQGRGGPQAGAAASARGRRADRDDRPQGTGHAERRAPAGRRASAGAGERVVGDAEAVQRRLELQRPPPGRGVVGLAAAREAGARAFVGPSHRLRGLAGVVVTGQVRSPSPVVRSIATASEDSIVRRCRRPNRIPASSPAGARLPRTRWCRCRPRAAAPPRSPPPVCPPPPPVAGPRRTTCRSSVAGWPRSRRAGFRPLSGPVAAARHRRTRPAHTPTASRSASCWHRSAGATRPVAAGAARTERYLSMSPTMTANELSTAGRSSTDVPGSRADSA